MTNNHGRPRLLDAFCGAGGATRGYQRAGFHVTGIDIAPMPRYIGDEFIQGDAIEFIAAHGHEFDAIHASPPCQRYSAMSACRPGLSNDYPDLIGPTRKALKAIGGLWVIENVMGAPLRQDLMLCGTMFGRELYRHRQFEFSKKARKRGIKQPDHPKHVIPGSRAGHWQPGQVISVSGNCAPVALAREVMGIDWTNRHELAESIPPYYAEHIGKFII